MADCIYYFAYGSNMSLHRLKKRINSAELVCTAKLSSHELRFHKISKDGSGKCDAFYTGNPNHCVFGAIYFIKSNELIDLDKFEGRGKGYIRKTVSVTSSINEELEVETYIATNIKKSLRPFDWYREHVIRGAQSIGLPSEYISSIILVEADIDPELERKTKELSIYKST